PSGCWRTSCSPRDRPATTVVQRSRPKTGWRCGGRRRRLWPGARRGGSMRLFIAPFGTETNTVAPIPTGLDDFRRNMWIEGNIAEAPPTPWAAPAQRWVRRARETNWEVVESLHTCAEPAGVTTREAYETIRDRILSDLRKAGPVDGVL